MATQRHQSCPAIFFITCPLILGLLLCMATLTMAAGAGVKLDGSLGQTPGVVSGGMVNGTPTTYLVTDTLGKKVGGNLFYSFGTFNIYTGESATFHSPTSSLYSNIISRVTGGSPSSIDGLLRSTIDGANLYFMNPSGVMFGPNASLDVKGSFHVTTADYLKFSDGGIFYANPNANSVLSVAPVESFGFLSANPAPISGDRSNLTVPSGNTVSVIGGDINFSGDSSWYNTTGNGITARAGKINLVSVASPGEVNLGTSDLGIGSFTKLGNITFSNYSDLTVEGSNYNTQPAGSVIIRGGQILFTSSDIWARGNPGGTIDIKGDSFHLNDGNISTASRGSTNNPGTAITIDAAGDLLVTNGSEIASSSYGTGRSGDIRISANNIKLGDDDPAQSLYAATGWYGDLACRSFGRGPSGSIYITAGNLTVQNGFYISTLAMSYGNAGNVTVAADTLKCLNRSSIFSNGMGAGAGGIVDLTARDILISATDATKVPNNDGLTGIAAQAGYYSKGGQIKITADTLQLLDGGQINTVLFSTGPGAGIDINAKDILIAGKYEENSIPYLSGINANLSGTYASGTGGNINIVTENLTVKDFGFIGTGLMQGATGNAGSIKITAGSLDISNGGSIYATSFLGTGSSGNLDITAKNLNITGIDGQTPTDPNYVFTGLSATTGSGRGGNIRVTADNISMASQGWISAATRGSGTGGSIEIDSQGILMTGSARIEASSGGSGRSGDVSINADNLRVENDSMIYAATSGSGQGGSVNISANDLSLSAHGWISAQTAYGGGSGGSINIESQNILLADGSWIEAGSFGSGNAGNIGIHAGTLRIENQGVIGARAFSSGQGGNINLEIGRLELAEGAVIKAGSLGTGNAGNINITAADSVILSNSSISTEAMMADGGNIQIHAPYMVKLSDSQITASVGGGPQTTGGNITIDPQYVILKNSQIIANAYEGKGGNIAINSNVFLADPDSIVDASSALGINGTVDIRAPITNVTGVLNPLSADYVSATALLRERCIARIQGGKYSSFVVGSRDGLPIEPGNLMPAFLR